MAPQAVCPVENPVENVGNHYAAEIFMEYFVNRSPVSGPFQTGPGGQNAAEPEGNSGSAAFFQ